MNPHGAFGSFDTLGTASGEVGIYRLDALEAKGMGPVSRLPYSLRVLLECLLRRCDGSVITEAEVEALSRWEPSAGPQGEVAFYPARVLLQDFTGLPAVVDLAAMRSAMSTLGGDPGKINPLIPVDLVIDHSVQVDRFGSEEAAAFNAEREFERNRERYQFLRWGQATFRNFRIVPPATGICHQVNLEYLASVVCLHSGNGPVVAFPDSLVGTDSHTTMINGLGVLGWGVGGIEAEAVMLGQPIYLVTPQVVGVRLSGELPEGATATDLVLAVTQLLRSHGVVEKFVEFFGPGLAALSLPDRATLANMAPEYGATVGFFPVDEETLRYLRQTGRDEARVDLVERYAKEQGLFRAEDSPDPTYTETLALDLASVEPSLAGPRRPQDRVALSEMKAAFRKALVSTYGKGAGPSASAAEPAEVEGVKVSLEDGAVVIASITSCTNTSNPSVMLAAGLLAKKAVERGLLVKPWVKTSLAPGSRVVTRYLEEAGLIPYLQALRFHLVGYGCATCIGNSGPIPEPVADAVRRGDLVAAAVLSGNRNFEGRVHPLTRANYLASPPLVVAYALAGTVDIDLSADPLGFDPNGDPVYLRDLWPSPVEIEDAIRQAVTPGMFSAEYADVFRGSELWNRIEAGGEVLYGWDPQSTYVREPPYFEGLSRKPAPPQPIRGARALAVLGDSVTTDHISPAGDIAPGSPAADYLQEHGVEVAEFNSYGSRRGNHEVMVRGTFGNIRLRNALVPGVEGGYTVHLPSGETVSIYEAAVRYWQEGTSLVILAGKDYGMGSSRDWAAKGAHLLGVRAVIAESFERIHRSNLIGMGVLPIQFREGESVKTLGLSGREVYEVEGIGKGLTPGQEVTVKVSGEGVAARSFTARLRLDTPVEVDYYRNGGILQAVLRKMLEG